MPAPADLTAWFALEPEAHAALRRWAVEQVAPTMLGRYSSTAGIVTAAAELEAFVLRGAHFGIPEAVNRSEGLAPDGGEAAPVECEVVGLAGLPGQEAAEGEVELVGNGLGAVAADVGHIESPSGDGSPKVDEGAGGGNAPAPGAASDPLTAHTADWAFPAPPDQAPQP